VADGGGARPESTRESGLPVAGGGGPGAGSGGEARALERRSRRGVEMGDEWSSASGERAARRQRGRGEKRREKVGVQAWGCHGTWPQPADDTRQWPERDARGRRAPPVEIERGEASDGWAAA
jgi:hypothetical protein